MFKEIAELKEQLAGTTDEVYRVEISRLLHKKQLALTIALEKYRRKH
jgi:hypothetical protein